MISAFRRRIIMLSGEVMGRLAAWFRKEGWHRSEPW